MTRSLARTALRAVALVAGVTLAVTVAAAWAVIARGDLIDTSRFARPDDSVTVVDQHGRPLRDARIAGIDRHWLPLRAVSGSLIAAVLAAEDKDFLRHPGVDARAVLRSAVRDLLPWRRLSGASTITQQLVKLVYGRRPGLAAKAIEAMRALSLERVFTKDEILEQYLNRVPFGDGIQGVGRASEAYLGHAASTLSVAEAALLAGVPQAPSTTEPRRHLARAIQRRNVVLARMLANGAIQQFTYDTALREQPAIRQAPARPWEAPRFVDAALTAWRAGALPRTEGVIATSLDLGLQRRVETLLDAQVVRFSSRGATNGAAIVVENATGQVVAYVGAARLSAAGGGLDLLRSRRQPGSSLKPFVYELLFEHGGSAATVLDDISVALHGARGTSFEARDYDGHERGPVRARVALSASLNLAALDAARRVGPDALVNRFRALGFHLDGDSTRYGAALVLGGCDVTPWELAGAWLALARGGTAVPLSLSALRSARPRAVLTPAATAVTWDILADSSARAEAFGADLVDAAGGRTFALKTGTSSGWRDAWATLADPTFTVVVWMGDPGGNPMAAVSGFEAAAPVAARILGAARSMSELDTPDSVPGVRLVEADVCAWSGRRAGPRCRRVVHERFAPGTVPTTPCDDHDASGAYRLPARFSAWAERVHPAGTALGTTAVPDGSPVVVEPRDGARWLLDPTQRAPSIELRATAHDAPVRDVTWTVDGVAVAMGQWTATPGRHAIVATRGGLASPPSLIDVNLVAEPSVPRDGPHDLTFSR